MYQLKQIPTEAQIRKFFRCIVFGKNVFCPRCRSRRTVRFEDRYRCRRCRLKFSLLSHTWLSSLRLPYQTFWLLLWSWTCQVPVKQTQALAGISRKGVYHWYRLFRDHLPENQVILEKIVQLDEAFFKKQALMMGKQKGTRKIAYTLLPTTNVQRQHAVYFLQQYVIPGSQLNTDGAGIYRGIENWWPVAHKKDIHKKWEFTLTSEIEGMFALFRTFVRRMYHHTTPDKLPEFVSEFCFRFSSPELFKNPLFYLEKTLKLVPIR